MQYINEIFLGNLNDSDRRATKDRRNRLSSYVDWLQEVGGDWYRPDFKAYQEVLIEQRGLSPTSAKAHLSTIRARYRALIEDGSIDEHLRRELVSTASEDGDLQRRIKQAIKAIEKEINPQRTRIQTEPLKTEYLRLTRDQAERLMAAPGLDTLHGLRDTFLIALMLCTGIRVIEASNLQIEHLNRQLEDGEPALYVPEARGCTERLIPYGNLKWVLELGHEWIMAAEISSGPLFRGFYKSSKSVRPTPLKSNAIIDIVSSYPLTTADETIVVTPMDLRRTYAQRLYEEGIDIVTLQEYLGLQNANAVIDYIGKPTVQTQQHHTNAIIPTIYSFQSYQ